MIGTLDLIGWRERLAGDRRVVAFTDDERGGVLWTVALCRHRWAARGLLKTLQAEEFTGAALRSQDSLWLGPAPEPPTGPAPLDFTGLDDLME